VTQVKALQVQVVAQVVILRIGVQVRILQVAKVKETPLVLAKVACMGVANIMR